MSCVSLDFVETPALLMEHFARDPRVLCAWATHHVSGAPLPAELARRATHQSSRFAALETQRSCLHALVDLDLHGERGGLDSARRVRELTVAHTLLPVRPDGESSTWHGAFRHLASYGAGYYTYLWARSLSMRVWHTCFESQPLRREGGKRWCRDVLRHGAARPPRELLAAMLQNGRRDPLGDPAGRRNESETDSREQQHEAAPPSQDGVDVALAAGLPHESAILRLVKL